MRRFRNQHDGGTEVALANFALTFAKALLVFSVVLFLMITPKKNGDGIKPKAEYLITVNWTSKDARYDVDTWMQLPNGSAVGFNHKESADLVFLERDDRGGDCVTKSEKPEVSPCEEVIVIRGKAPGDYVLALHLYSENEVMNDNVPVPPMPISVTITRLNPSVEIVWQKTVSFDHIRQEIRLVRFTMEADGSIDKFNRDELPSVVYPENDNSRLEQAPEITR